MKIKMDMRVLNIIHCVQDYKRFLISYHNLVLDDMNFPWYTEVQKFYNRLLLPEGMKKCKSFFEAVLNYPKEKLDELDNKQESELSQYYFNY